MDFLITAYVFKDEQSPKNWFFIKYFSFKQQGQQNAQGYTCNSAMK